MCTKGGESVEDRVDEDINWYTMRGRRFLLRLMTIVELNHFTHILATLKRKDTYQFAALQAVCNTCRNCLGSTIKSRVGNSTYFTTLHRHETLGQVPLHQSSYFVLHFALAHRHPQENEMA